MVSSIAATIGMKIVQLVRIDFDAWLGMVKR